MKISEYDPFPVELEKYEHHFEEKQKVRIKKDGREGVIEAVNHNGQLNVKLDSGHSVQCLPSECEPADFPPAHSGSGHDGAVENAFSPADGLVKAIREGTISDADLVIVKLECAKIQRDAVASDPLSCGDRLQKNPAYDRLQILCRKYSGAGHEFAKRAKPRMDLAVGKKVHGIGGKIGVITKVTDYYVEVDYGGNGVATELVHAVQLVA